MINIGAINMGKKKTFYQDKSQAPPEVKYDIEVEISVEAFKNIRNTSASRKNICLSLSER
jgi:hypothetical protein